MDEILIVARRLKEARLRAGISQRQLAIKAGINESGASSRMSQYESAKYKPDPLTLKRLAAVLKVPVPYFHCSDNDAELAELILKFSALGKVQRKRLLGLVDEL
jgi:transcriptional regulator with XRE-family HTH domain